ncbi:FkbM family methyltransferase [Mesorhizobium sp. M0018]
MIRIANIAVGGNRRNPCFRAHPDVYRKLSNTMKSGHFLNLRCNSIALADKAGVMTFYMAVNGVSSSVPREHLTTNELKSADGTTVNVTTLDLYHATMAKPTDFVKLDLEGYELVPSRGPRS